MRTVIGEAWVLDAGVAAKWYLADEPLIPQADAIFEAFRNRGASVAVPDLFWPEFGNILWKAQRNGRISPADAHLAVCSLTAEDIPTWPSQPLLPRAWAIAQAHGRTVYDAIYVALAVEMRCEVITADEKLVNALGSRLPVRWLGSLN